MNKRVKRLWVKALRSGEYRQAKKFLRTKANGEIRYCCLGVLCEIYRQETQDGSWGDSTNKAWFQVSDGGDDAELPVAVMEWAEIDDPDPQLGVSSNAPTAAKLNDRGETFEYIADRIEKHL